jgi:CBS-domain-containing membrane protein
MRAKDVMSTPVITVRPDTEIKSVAALLIQHEIGAVPVVDEEDRLVGIVSEADLVELETAPDPRSRFLPVRGGGKSVPHTANEVMTTNVVALPQDADISQVARLMLERRIRQIPIVAGTRLVGIVARRDLLRVLARKDVEIGAEVEELLDDEMLMLGKFGVAVSSGVVTLRGSADRPARRLAELLTRSIPGVLGVEFVEVNP